MTSTKRTYSLNKIRQLIDLNGDSTNFDVTFKVTSHNGEPFDIVVADQNTLDNSPDLQYRKAERGEMSGNFIQDKNVYQNYFLVLKADQPCNCDIEITRKDLPQNPNTNITQSDIPSFDPNSIEGSTESQSKSSEGGINWKLWLIIGLVVIGSGVLFFIFYSDKKKTGTEGAKTTSTVSNAPKGLDYFPSPSPESGSESPISLSQGVSPSPTEGNNLVQRLKKLHMHT